LKAAGATVGGEDGNEAAPFAARDLNGLGARGGCADTGVLDALVAALVRFKLVVDALGVRRTCGVTEVETLAFTRGAESGADLVGDVDRGIIDGEFVLTVIWNFLFVSRRRRH
jgi:hypothetical protein